MYFGPRKTIKYLLCLACSCGIMSRCVVQGCSNSSNPAAGISLHWSPANKGREMESFRLLTPKKISILKAGSWFVRKILMNIASRVVPH